MMQNTLIRFEIILFKTVKIFNEKNNNLLMKLDYPWIIKTYVFIFFQTCSVVLREFCDSFMQVSVPGYSGKLS